MRVRVVEVWGRGGGGSSMVGSCLGHQSIKLYASLFGPMSYGHGQTLRTMIVMFVPPPPLYTSLRHRLIPEHIKLDG